MSTGYFGVPGRIGGKVHFVMKGAPICGTVFHKEALFQWCADGFQERLVECEKCKKELKRIFLGQMG